MVKRPNLEAHLSRSLSESAKEDNSVSTILTLIAGLFSLAIECKFSKACQEVHLQIFPFKVAIGQETRF